MKAWPLSDQNRYPGTHPGAEVAAKIAGLVGQRVLMTYPINRTLFVIHNDVYINSSHVFFSLFSFALSNYMFRVAHRAAQLSSHLKARTPIDKVRNLRIVATTMSHQLYEEATPAEVKNAKV